MRPTPFQLRSALFGAVLLSWLFMVWRMWVAFSTPPSAAGSEQGRMLELPSLAGFGWEAGKSLLELVFAALLLWPWSGRHYTLRLAAGGAALLAWFLATTPLDLSAVVLVHRRWLGLLALTLLALSVVLVLARAWRALRERR